MPEKATSLDFAVEKIDVVQLDIARAPDGLLAGMKDAGAT